MANKERIDNYIAHDIDTAKTTADRIHKINGHPFMDLIGYGIVHRDKFYKAESIDYIQSPGEYPCIRATAVLNPFNSSAYKSTNTLSITNVIFHPPATIVFWSDNTKTVVKCDYGYEDYDPEKGIAMAISKKMLGENKYEYYNTFLHWLKKWNKQQDAKTINDICVKDDWNGDMCNV